MSRPGRVAALALIVSLTAVGARAQLLRPPGSIGGAPLDVEQAQSQDAAGLMVRLDRAESQLRAQTGQIEQMQFQIKRLEDQLRKFQEDVDFRFQDAAGTRKPAARPPAAGPTPAPAPGRRTELNENGYPVVGQIDDTPGDATPTRAAASARGLRRGDAFDPDADPTAPGAPRPIGETPSPSAPPRAMARAATAPLTHGPIDDGTDIDMDRDPGAPLDLMHRDDGLAPAPQTPRRQTVVAGLGAPPSGAAPRIVGGESQAATPVALPPSSPKEELDAGVAALRGGQFDSAEETFRNFLQKHPKDRLAADATFYLGESYYKRSRSREAAEQYLKVSTDFEKSSRAPEALLKLGLSLEKLGAREQACAAYGEVARKYPSAIASIRASAERESKRSQC